MYVYMHTCVHMCLCISVCVCILVYLRARFLALSTERAEKQRHPSSNEHTGSWSLKGTGAPWRNG